MGKNIHEQIFYPEIQEHGSLKQAFRAEFEKINSELKDKIVGINKRPKIEVEQKSVVIMAAIKKRLFLYSFWNYGDILVATGDTECLKDAALVMHNWLILNSKISDLTKDFDFIKPTEQNELIEKGNYVELNWQKYEELIEKQSPKLISVFQEAKKNQNIRKHIIFTSHFSLCFSSCKVVHLCSDVLITPLSDDQFGVSLNGFNKILGSYSAEKAVRVVAENIKDQCPVCNKIK